jgi:hypothetical protein
MALKLTIDIMEQITMGQNWLMNNLFFINIDFTRVLFFFLIINTSCQIIDQPEIAPSFIKIEKN